MLKLPDLTAQPLNLAARVFNFTANKIDIRHRSLPQSIRTNQERNCKPLGIEGLTGGALGLVIGALARAFCLGGLVVLVELRHAAFPINCTRG
jgi:hypothetical protein